MRGTTGKSFLMLARQFGIGVGSGTLGRACINENRKYLLFDINHDGLVEVERMPQFLRYLLGNSLEIGLQ